MGAWGAGTFDNDTACDWSGDLAETNDLSLVITTLGRVLDTEDYLDSDIATEGLAGCEVIARLKGNWGPRNPYTEPVDSWVQAHPLSVPPDLATTALAVIDRVLSPNSELLELWTEGEDSGEWRKAVEDLRARVQGLP